MYENPGLYNADCMEAMKEFPDNFFDLAIVDPPYGGGFTEGGGCKGWFSKYHQNVENTDIGGGWNGKALHVRTAKERQKLREPEEHGRANTQKNSCVGHCPETGVF